MLGSYEDILRKFGKKGRPRKKSHSSHVRNVVWGNDDPDETRALFDAMMQDYPSGSKTFTLRMTRLVRLVWLLR